MEVGAPAILVENAGTLCEGPVWDERTGLLHWVDILAGRILATDPASAEPAAEQESWQLDWPVGAIAPRAAGGWVAAVERGFASFSADWEQLGDVTPAPGQGAGTRFNDGKCDPAGRFWAGTMAYAGTPGAGCLYRMDPDGTVTSVLDGATVSNGLGWSPDGGTMYYVDTARGTLDAMDFDGDSGTPSNRRTVVSVPVEEGAPDGMTIDADGYLWVALWDGGAVRRYTPEGELVATVTLPVSRVTSMAFGGSELGELFITTASDGLDERRLAEQPLAGSLFRCTPGVRGMQPAAFVG